MKNNKLTIRIDKSVHEVFLFVITPPNSTLWINEVIGEEINEWSIKVGTIYRLTDPLGKISEVSVETLENDKTVGWLLSDHNYHCKYELDPINNKSTEFSYLEWVDKGEIEKPFVQETLEKLKEVVENLEPNH